MCDGMVRFSHFQQVVFMLSVFQKFGGIRPMASKLGDVPPSTVKSWHAEGRIPVWRHDTILAAAKKIGVPLTRDELVNVRPDAPENDAAQVANAA